MSITIFHNPRCSKSRYALEQVCDTNTEVKVFSYLTEPITEEMMIALLKKLKIKPEQLVRKKEPIFQELYAGKKMTDKQYIKAMLKYPVLIERPIVIKGNKAWIARDEETINEIVRLT